MLHLEIVNRGNRGIRTVHVHVHGHSGLTGMTSGLSGLCATHGLCATCLVGLVCAVHVCIDMYNNCKWLVGKDWQFKTGML